MIVRKKKVYFSKYICRNLKEKSKKKAETFKKRLFFIYGVSVPKKLMTIGITELAAATNN